MGTLYLSFLIPFLAGIATLIGYLPTYIPYRYHEVVISSSLSFSAGVMIIVSFGSLLPEAFQFLSIIPFITRFLLVTLFFLCGGLFALFLDCFFEHTIQQNSLYKLGLISFGALLLHNIPEGITTFLATSTNLKLGITLSLAIAFHNIPEGIAVAIPIYYASGSHLKAFLYTLLSGFSEFLGAILACLFIKQEMSSLFLIFILCFTAGVMSYLAFFELLPKAFTYPYFKSNIMAFFIGIILLVCCIFLFI